MSEYFRKPIVKTLMLKGQEGQSITESVEPGLYYYDLQIGINGDVFSILIGSLKIHSDVTIGVN